MVRSRPHREQVHISSSTIASVSSQDALCCVIWNIFDALILHRDASTVMCSCICDAAVQNVDTVEGSEVLAHIESPSLSESPSSSGDQFWFAAVSNGTPIDNETADGNANSLYQRLKPTVSELCNILKFSAARRVSDWVIEHDVFVLKHTSVGTSENLPS
ncbi:hypothetical protein Tco_0605991 [Tanacetum coccineum]